MRLYLATENTSDELKYTPDWIRLEFNDKADLVLDVQGDIDYEEGINCRVKGDLIPWVTFDEVGNDINLYDMDESELNQKYSLDKINELFAAADNVVVGVIPVGVSEEDLMTMDFSSIMSAKGEGKVFIVGAKPIEFEFDVEIND